MREFSAAVDDESSQRQAKQIADGFDLPRRSSPTAVTSRSVDLIDKAAVDAVIGELNATKLSQRLIEAWPTPAAQLRFFVPRLGAYALLEMCSVSTQCPQLGGLGGQARRVPMP